MINISITYPVISKGLYISEIPRLKIIYGHWAMILLLTLILQTSIILNRFNMKNIISYTFVYVKKVNCIIFSVVYIFLYILDN